MKRVNLLLFILLFLVSTPAVKAQMTPQKPITWRVNVKMTTPSEGEVIIKAIIEDGWHLYGFSLPNGGPKPTVIDLSPSTGVEFTSRLTCSSSPAEHHDAMFGKRLNWWDSDVTFRRKFKITDPASARIIGAIHYMGCDNNTCLPPETENISKAIPNKK